MVGKEIKRIRKTIFNMKQYEFAELLGVTRESVLNWEKEHTRIPYKNLKKIADLIKEMEVQK